MKNMQKRMVEKDIKEINMKYFKPIAEEIRIGTDYEYRTNGDDWIKHTVYSSIDLKEAIDDLETNDIRIKYLEKEDIEAEGWVQEKNYFYKDSIRPLDVNRTYELVYNYEFKQLKISYDCGEFLPWYIFDGFCKDINTFRYICKLLGI